MLDTLSEDSSIDVAGIPSIGRVETGNRLPDEIRSINVRKKLYGRYLLPFPRFANSQNKIDRHHTFRTRVQTFDGPLSFIENSDVYWRWIEAAFTERALH